jgi:hypothetical protein
MSPPVEESSNMVKLYACPKDEKPYVQMAALQEGRYVEVAYLSLRTFIDFSDVGAAARKAALELDDRVTASLVGYSWLEEDKSWIVVFEGPRVNVVLSSQRYKGMGGFDKAFYISIGITGDESHVSDFARRFVKVLGRNPLEGIEWEKLAESEDIERTSAEADWKKYGGT